MDFRTAEDDGGYKAGCQKKDPRNKGFVAVGGVIRTGVGIAHNTFIME